MSLNEETPKIIFSQIKQEFFEILEKTTFQGLPNIFTPKSLISGVFWFILTALSYSFCAYLITISILEYNKFEVVTRYENVFENVPVFPKVFFCDHDVNRTRCLFNKMKCQKIEKSTDPKCEFFNTATFKSNEYGHGSGLQLQLYAANARDGIRIYITNQSQIYFTDPRYISPGIRTSLVMKRIFEKRLPKPYSDCQINVTGSKKLDVLEKPYYHSECFKVYCLYHLIAQNCNLLDEFLGFSYLFYVNRSGLFMPAFNSTIKNNCEPSLHAEAVQNFYNNRIGVCREICPVECNSFDLSISEFSFKLPDGEFPEHYAELNIFYETFFYTLISQTPKISENALWGTIGGHVGLFVGATFLSLGEIIDLFLGIIRKVKKYGKKVKRERVFKIRQKSSDSVVRI